MAQVEDGAMISPPGMPALRIQPGMSLTDVLQFFGSVGSSDLHVFAPGRKKIDVTMIRLGEGDIDDLINAIPTLPDYSPASYSYDRSEYSTEFDFIPGFLRNHPLHVERGNTRHPRCNKKRMLVLQGTRSIESDSFGFNNVLQLHHVRWYLETYVRRQLKPNPGGPDNLFTALLSCFERSVQETVTVQHLRRYVAAVACRHALKFHQLFKETITLYHPGMSYKEWVRSLLLDSTFGDHMTLYLVSFGLDLSISIVQPWKDFNYVQFTHLRHEEEIHLADLVLVHDSAQHYTPTVEVTREGVQLRILLRSLDFPGYTVTGDLGATATTHDPSFEDQFSPYLVRMRNQRLRGPLGMGQFLELGEGLYFPSTTLYQDVIQIVAAPKEEPKGSSEELLQFASKASKDHEEMMGLFMSRLSSSLMEALNSLQVTEVTNSLKIISSMIRNCLLYATIPIDEALMDTFLTTAQDDLEAACSTVKAVTQRVTSPTSSPDTTAEIPNITLGVINIQPCEIHGGHGSEERIQVVSVKTSPSSQQHVEPGDHSEEKTEEQDMDVDDESTEPHNLPVFPQQEELPVLVADLRALVSEEVTTPLEEISSPDVAPAYLPERNVVPTPEAADEDIAKKGVEVEVGAGATSGDTPVPDVVEQDEDAASVGSAYYENQEGDLEDIGDDSVVDPSFDQAFTSSPDKTKQFGFHRQLDTDDFPPFRCDEPRPTPPDDSTGGADGGEEEHLSKDDREALDFDQLVVTQARLDTLHAQSLLISSAVSAAPSTAPVEPGIIPVDDAPERQVVEGSSSPRTPSPAGSNEMPDLEDSPSAKRARIDHQNILVPKVPETSAGSTSIQQQWIVSDLEVTEDELLVQQTLLDAAAARKRGSSSRSSRAAARETRSSAPPPSSQVSPKASTSRRQRTPEEMNSCFVNLARLPVTSGSSLSAGSTSSQFTLLTVPGQLPVQVPVQASSHRHATYDEQYFPLVRASSADGYFRCIVCHSRFETMRELRIHTRLHTGAEIDPAGSLVCTCGCGKPFKKASSLLVHHQRLVATQLGKSEKCPTCGKKFPIMIDVQKHFSKMHRQFSEKELTCEKCGKTSLERYLHLRHIRICGRPPLECLQPGCTTTFLDAFDRNAHYVRLHPGIPYPIPRVRTKAQAERVLERKKNPRPTDGKVVVPEGPNSEEASEEDEPEV